MYIHTHSHTHTPHQHLPLLTLPLRCAPCFAPSSFYRTVLSDLLITSNDSFFNYAFSQVFSRKLQARINGQHVTYDQLRIHFLQLRKTYYARGHGRSREVFADAGTLKFGKMIAQATNGDREGYLAAHTVIANLVNAAPSYRPPQGPLTSDASSSDSSSSSSGEEGSEDEQDVEDREQQDTSSSGFQQQHQGLPHFHHVSARRSPPSSPKRVRYNALVVTDTMEIQWMEGIEGECRKITKFDRTMRRPSSSKCARS